jgi:hypothetical protein
MRERKKLAKWKRKALDKVVRLAQEGAACALKEIGGVPSVRFALVAKKKILVFPCTPGSDTEKVAMFEGFREVLHSTGGWAYVEVMEAWFAPSGGVRPSEHSGRQEGVVILSVLPSGLDTARMFDIERTEDGTTLGQPWDEDLDEMVFHNAFEVGDTPLPKKIH